ncbi:MAG TPA: tripartite tricarboxylate transporter substrate binding protein [Xanthobacteraceae bacterium]
MVKVWSRLFTGIAACFAAILFAAIATADAEQKYPERPIRMIVPFPPGGPIDTMARVVAEELSTRLGQVVVENRAGGGSTIGTKYVAAADPDGYTLLFGSSGSLAVAPALYASLGLDPLKVFAPIATVALLPHVFVENLDVPARTIAEFIAYAKANPGKLNFGAGLGTPPHLLSTLFKTEAHIDVVYIPYTGSAQSVNDLLGGRTQFTIDGMVGLYPLIKAGKVRALAVARSERWPALPDVPTLAESGFPDFVIDAWTGVVAPAGTPRPIIEQLNAAINAGLQSPLVQEKLAKFSAIAKLGTPEDFKTFLAAQMQRWAAIVKIAGARLD